MLETNVMFGVKKLLNSFELTWLSIAFLFSNCCLVITFAK